MSESINDLNEIQREELLSWGERYKNEGYRLVLITCTKVDARAEITYSFGRDLSLRHLRLFAQEGEEIPSITGIYWGAFVYENEIHDLFGITIKDINIDYKGRFYKTAVTAPFSLTSTKVVDPCQNR